MTDEPPGRFAINGGIAMLTGVGKGMRSKPKSLYDWAWAQADTNPSSSQQESALKQPCALATLAGPQTDDDDRRQIEAIYRQQRCLRLDLDIAACRILDCLSRFRREVS